jgi:hypothetical protein
MITAHKSTLGLGVEDLDERATRQHASDSTAQAENTGVTVRTAPELNAPLGVKQRFLVACRIGVVW